MNFQVVHFAHLLAVANAQVHGSDLGTAQDMTFAVILGTFMGFVVLILFSLRSGHERARRRVVSREMRQREESRERSRILEAHELPPSQGEGLPR